MRCTGEGAEGGGGDETRGVAAGVAGAGVQGGAEPVVWVRTFLWVRETARLSKAPAPAPASPQAAHLAGHEADVAGTRAGPLA